MSSEEKKEEMPDKDTLCGIMSCRPRWLQKLASPVTFLIVFAALGLIQGAFWTYFIGVVTTIEKRYAFESKLTGLILLADNISPVITSFIIGFFGGRGNRPFWLAMAMLLASLSSFLSAMPYWIYGAQTYQEDILASNDTQSHRLCSFNGTNEEQCDSGRSNSITIPAVVIFFVGNFVNGIGSTSFYVLGSSYLDDSFTKEKAPLFFGIISSVRLFGPTLGFLLSANVLKFYEDPSVTPNFNEKDPRWVGAWWIGFVVSGTSLLILSFIFTMFPKEIPWEANKKSLKVEREMAMKEKLNEFPKKIKNVLKNKLLICTTLGNCFYFMAAFGFFQYMPKFIQSQFQKTASHSNAISGITSTVIMAFGFLVSGLLISKIKPRPRFLTGWTVLVDFLNCLGMMIAMKFGCDSNDVLDDNTISDDCHCNYASLKPICDKQNMNTYFSSCHAGCNSSYLANDTTYFSGCSLNGESTKITEGFCPSTCDTLLYYMIIIVITKALGSTSKVGTLIVTLRCVSKEDKSLALSMVSLLTNLISNIPTPIIFGTIVDAACKIWKFSCNEKGNCWVYDSVHFRYYLHGVTAFIYFIAMIFDMLMCYYSNELTNLYNDDEADLKEKNEELSRNGSTTTEISKL